MKVTPGCTRGVHLCMCVPGCVRAAQGEKAGIPAWREALAFVRVLAHQSRPLGTVGWGSVGTGATFLPWVWPVAD